MGRSRGRGLETRGPYPSPSPPHPPWKIIAIGFLRNLGTDHPSRGRSVWPSVNYVDDQNTNKTKLRGGGGEVLPYVHLTIILVQP